MTKLFVAVLLVTLLELSLLVALGRTVGPLPVLGLLTAGALGGTLLLRRQGVAALALLRAALERGELPAAALAGRLLRAMAALLLIFPGLLTDLAGLLLLLPPGRALARRLLQRRWQRYVREHQIDPPPPAR